MFVIATREPAEALSSAEPGALHGRAVRLAFENLPSELKRRWLWWRLPAPLAGNARLADMLEADEVVTWRSPEQTGALLAQLSPAHARQWAGARAGGERVVAAVFRRIRWLDGVKVQRAELRLDGVAGCLRTPAGGSSRQLLLVGDVTGVRSRLLTAREGARLMGLPEDYRLPSSQTAAMRLVGDGLAVPVVRFLAEHLLEPLLTTPVVFAAAE